MMLVHTLFWVMLVQCKYWNVQFWLSRDLSTAIIVELQHFPLSFSVFLNYLSTMPYTYNIVIAVSNTFNYIFNALLSATGKRQLIYN